MFLRLQGLPHQVVSQSELKTVKQKLDSNIMIELAHFEREYSEFCTKHGLVRQPLTDEGALQTIGAFHLSIEIRTSLTDPVVKNMRWRGAGEPARGSSVAGLRTSGDIAKAPVECFINDRLVWSSFQDDIIRTHELTSAYHAYCDLHNVPASKRKKISSSPVLTKAGGSVDSSFAFRYVVGCIRLLPKDNLAKTAGHDHHNYAQVANDMLASVTPGPSFPFVATIALATSEEEEKSQPSFIWRQLSTFGDFGGHVLEHPVDAFVKLSGRLLVPGTLIGEAVRVFVHVMFVLLVPMLPWIWAHWILGLYNLDMLATDLDLRPHAIFLHSATSIHQFIAGLLLATWAIGFMECFMFYRTIETLTQLFKIDTDARIHFSAPRWIIKSSYEVLICIYISLELAISCFVSLCGRFSPR